jgi:hypothetical protein
MSLQGLKYVVSGPREGRLDVVNLMCYAFWHLHTRVQEAVASGHACFCLTGWVLLVLDGVKCQ